MKNQKIIFALLIGQLIFGLTFSQNEYKININVPEKKIISGHLNLGGSNPAGEKIE